MEKFILHNIHSGQEATFSTGVYIILFNATQIPPHLLLSINGKVFSITDSGRQLGSPLEKLITFVKRKNIPTLFIEWDLMENSVEGFSIREVEKVESLIRNSFLQYDKVIEGKVSCLIPIRDVAAKVLGDEIKKAQFIFELLPMMEKRNVIGNTYSLNMEQAIFDGQFELLTYTEKQLKQSVLETKKN